MAEDRARAQATIDRATRERWTTGAGGVEGVDFNLNPRAPPTEEELDVPALRDWMEIKMKGGRADGATDLRKYAIGQIQVYHLLRKLPPVSEEQAARILDEHLKGVVA